MRLIFILSLICISGCYSQSIDPEIHIVYDFEYDKFIDSKKKRVEKTILIVQPSKSYFSYKTSFNLAVTRTTKTVSDMGVLMYNIKPNFIIATESKKDSLNFYEYIGGKIYDYKEKVDLEWEFDESTKIILGYTCHKVRTSYGSRNWIGWYCKDIAISRGPYKFNGLPGALLEISSDDGLFKFSASEIYRVEDSTSLNVLDFLLEPNKEIISMERKKLNRFRNKYDNLSPGERAYVNRPDKNAEYTIMTIDESGERKAVEYNRRQRNYIEKIN